MEETTEARSVTMDQLAPQDRLCAMYINLLQSLLDEFGTESIAEVMTRITRDEAHVMSGFLAAIGVLGWDLKGEKTQDELQRIGADSVAQFLLDNAVQESAVNSDGKVVNGFRIDFARFGKP